MMVFLCIYPPQVPEQMQLYNGCVPMMKMIQHIDTRSSICKHRSLILYILSKEFLQKKNFIKPAASLTNVSPPNHPEFGNDT